MEKKPLYSKDKEIRALQNKKRKTPEEWVKIAEYYAIKNRNGELEEFSPWTKEQLKEYEIVELSEIEKTKTVKTERKRKK